MASGSSHQADTHTAPRSLLHIPSAALGVLGEPPQPIARPSGLRPIASCSTAITFHAVKIRMREAVGQAAAQASLLRHNSLWAA